MVRARPRHSTLDLLQRVLNHQGLAIKRSQIRRILQAEQS